MVIHIIKGILHSLTISKNYIKISNIELMRFGGDNVCKRVADNVKETGKINILQTTDSV